MGAGGVGALALDLSLALDPSLLFERAIGPPDAWQRDALRSAAPRMLWNASRQSGKSSVAACLAVHAAAFTPKTLVILCSPGLRQSAELLRKCLDVTRALGLPEPPAADSALRLELGNGSRLIALPGTESTIRGYSAPALVVVDEASRVPDDVYRATTPMLAVSGGRLVALSTPWGARGWWHAAWTSDEPWERYEVPATACPRIGADFLEQERRSMGSLAFRSEYLCEFVDTEDNVFSSEHVHAALDDSIQPLWGAA